MQNRFAMAGVAIALVGLTACSDSPVSPAAKIRPPVMTGPGFALIVQPTGVPGGPNTMTVCSANGAATFAVSSFSAGGGVPQVNPPIAGGALSGPPAGPYTLVVAANTCQTIWIKSIGLSEDPTTSVTVTQTAQEIGYAFGNVEAAGNTGTSVNVAGQAATLAANLHHGATATFTQTEVETGDVCDRYTWGGHRKDLNYTYGGHAGLNTAGLAWGSFEFNNHATGDKYHVWNITAYGKPASGPLAGTELGRFASGTGLKNGTTPVFMEFRFIDTGEPGKDSDQVWLAIDGNVVLDLQTVTGGNIQYHAQCKKAPKAEKH